MVLDTTLLVLYTIYKRIIYKKNIEIYSPEFDLELIKSLENFDYPEEFNKINHIIKDLSKNLEYEDKNIKIKLFIADAREYIKDLSNIDIVYQDAFSSEVNKELWSVEYFKDIYNLCSDNAIITTYAVSTNIRLSLYEAGFEIYEIRPVKKRNKL